MVKTAGSYLSELRRAPVYNLVIDRTGLSNVSVGPEYSNNIFAKIFETPGICTIVLLADWYQAVMTDLKNIDDV